jgi:hypothetical protein
MFGLDLEVRKLLPDGWWTWASYSSVGIWPDRGWTLVGLYLKATSRVFFIIIKVSPQHQ